VAKDLANTGDQVASDQGEVEADRVAAGGVVSPTQDLSEPPPSVQPTVPPSEAEREGAEAISAGDDEQLVALSPSRTAVGAMVSRLVTAIRDGDEKMVESAVLTLSRRSRLLAPLAMVVGAFAMLFQGIKLLFTNWRLTLVQILPAMWIWAAMLDLKVHVLHGKSFHPLYGLWLIPIVLGIAAITAAGFFLNAVFAFAIAVPGSPQIRPAFAEARRHKATVLTWGFVIGLALGFATMVTNRWGVRWFGLSLGIVVAVMMVAYVAVPGRLVGLSPSRSRRDKLTASAVGGAMGALVCSPPYLLGRVSILLLGSPAFRFVAVILLIIAVVLQTGATSAVKAIKLSAKLTAGRDPQTSPVAAPTAGPARGIQGG
jgi:hypothetical protein